MKEQPGNLWDWVGKRWIVIPINVTVTAGGNLVMGAGVAGQAKKRWPTLARSWGAEMQKQLLRPGPILLIHDEYKLIGLPTKVHFTERSNLNLILAGVDAMVEWARKNNNPEVVLPKLGCGLGGLDWADVRHPLDARLNDQFTVLT